MPVRAGSRAAILPMNRPSGTGVSPVCLCSHGRDARATRVAPAVACIPVQGFKARNSFRGILISTFSTARGEKSEIRSPKSAPRELTSLPPPPNKKPNEIGKHAISLGVLVGGGGSEVSLRRWQVSRQGVSVAKPAVHSAPASRRRRNARSEKPPRSPVASASRIPVAWRTTTSCFSRLT